jgi:alkanesulfonate monooxygenase SsuD/methylene tetrahydromethanopterin reductase-like flavin-dependent oxidoreductase (luciferase family)
MHLNLNLRGVGFHRAGWRHPSAEPERILDVDFFTDLVQTAERGKLDAVFFADTPAVFGNREPLAMPLEPLTLLAALAARTARIGLIGTVSTTYHEPYEVAERFASLDLLSGGRAGVNVVTSAGDHVARNFGHDAHPEPERRYERASEFVDALYALWAGEPLELAGPRFAARGAPPWTPSPQGRPVIVQAGASPSGRHMAATHAEAVYTGSSTIPNGLEFRHDVRARAAALGRSPDGVKILPGIVPYVGATETEAKALEAELEELAIRHEDPIARLARELDADLSRFDPDVPLPFDELPERRAGTSRTIRLRTWTEQENLSLRQLAVTLERSLGVIHWVVAGTAEQIADELEAWYRAGAADGFNVLVPLHPRGTRDFVEQVVPELQRRGLFRTEYEGSTLRQHFGLPVPAPLHVPA